MIFDPLHYLPLLEQKVGAFDQAAPLKGWDLSVEFATLHRLLEARMGKKGKRCYVQVLRLLETFEMRRLHGAVKQALGLGAIGYDAVKHLVLCAIEKRPPWLDLEFHPCLPKALVETTKPASYMSLMQGRPHDRCTAGLAAPSSQEAPFADLPVRIRQAGPTMRRREQGSCTVSPAAVRVGTFPSGEARVYAAFCSCSAFHFHGRSSSSL
jgi:hypothetical protein